MKTILVLTSLLIWLYGQAQTTLFYQLPSYRFPANALIDSGYTFNNMSQIEYTGSIGDESKNIFIGSNISYRNNAESVGIQFTNFYSTNINDALENYPYRNITYQILTFNKSILLKNIKLTGGLSFSRKNLRTKNTHKLGVDFGVSGAWKSHSLSVSKINVLTTNDEDMFPFLDFQRGLNFQYFFTKKLRNWIIQPTIAFNTELFTFSTLTGFNVKYKNICIGILKLDNYKSMHKIGWDFGQFKMFLGREGLLFSSLAIVEPQYFHFQIIYKGKNSGSLVLF